MPETIPQIRPSFNRSLRLETRPELLSADTGALVQRELMERSGLIDWLTERLHDPRHPSSIRYPLSDLLRTRLLLLGQGWRDQSDADRLRQDPSLRVASRTRRGTAALEEGQGLASQPTLSRLLDTLSREENLPVLHQAVTELACRRIEMIEGQRRKRGKKTPRKKRRKKTMYLDVDGLPVEVHGHPPGSEWNGYYRQRMYHGLVASCAETGDLIDGEIFPGASYLGKKALKLTLRVVLVVRERPGELYPDHFWLLTSLSRKRYEAQELLAQYRKRGKAEGHMGEFMDVLDPALSSASRPKTHYRGQPLKSEAKPEARTEAGVRPHNEVRFLLNLLGYEILHLGRVLMEQATRRGWSLRRFRERVLRVASRALRQGRRLIFVISQGATDWKRLWQRLARVSWAPG